jgi:hypothetical protein
MRLRFTRHARNRMRRDQLTTDDVLAFIETPGGGKRRWSMARLIIMLG